MERFKAVDAGVITQKENNPSLAKDENDRILQREITDSNMKLNFAQQVGVGQSQQPLKVRNMATQSQSQTQLLEKFRKLRQWQQQQQESMFRQQQQAMETLKMEQSKLQSILAAQKKLQEQQNISSLAVQSPSVGMPSGQADNRRSSPMMVENQPQQSLRIPPSVNTVTRPEVENDGRELVVQNSTDLLRTIPTSSFSPISGLVAVSQGESSSWMSEVQIGPLGSQPQIEVPRLQQVANEEERHQGSVASFNATVYPTMWNSSNYHLPLGMIPLSTGTQDMPLQGQPGLSPGSLGSAMSHLGMNSKEMTKIAQGYQSPDSTPELERLRKYMHETESPSNLGMNVIGNSGAVQRNSVPVTILQQQQQQLERLWSHNPGAQTLASVDSQADEQSEADAMSGVYPIYDSESEMGVDEVEDKGAEDEEVDAKSDAEEDSSEKDKTVIDLGTLPVESTEKNENPQEESDTEVDDEMRPIKPGIGAGSSVKTFEELLEQQLKLEEASKAVTTSQAVNQKPQKTFLRKGQGLARFKGKSTSKKTVGHPQESESQATGVSHTKENKDRNAVPNLTQGKNKSSVPSGVPVTQGRITRKVASKSPQVSSETHGEITVGKQQQPKGSNGSKTQAPTCRTEAKTTTTTANKPMPMPQSGVFTRTEESNPSGLLNSIDASFQMRLQELEKNQEIEEEELEEFELLEQAAANASFSSNSSVVVKVLAKARGNVQDSKHVSKEQSVTNNRGAGGILSPVDRGYSSGDGRVRSSANQPGLYSHMNQLHDNVSDDEDSDVTLQEMSLDSALELEESDKEKHEQAKNPQEKALAPFHFEQPTASLEIEDDFNDEEAWGEIKKQAGTNSKSINDADDDFDDDDDDDSDVTISDIFPLVTSTPPIHLKGGKTQRQEQAVNNEADGLAASTPPTSALVTKLFPQLKPKQKPAQVAPKQQTSEVPQSRPGEEKIEASSEAVQSIAVRQKLKELETEIDKFRSENAALAKMRAEREEGLKKLQTEIAAFEKQKTEELERLEQFREEELRKLRRERRVFEKYQKAARTIPDKRERDEIEALRVQVAELQEELKRRESRWSAASTRSRQRIEALEQEKKELQDEVKLLEQYRLEQWRDEQTKQAREEEEEEEETGPKKPLRRKIAKTTEEESGPRLPPNLRSPPLRPDLVETVPRSTPQNKVVGPENRIRTAGFDANNNQTAGLCRDENPLSDEKAKLSEESSEMLSVNTTERNYLQDIQQSQRRSPRRRSKTPDSTEKMKRNVHFQDDDIPRQSAPDNSDSLSERTGRQDQREIMHPDGKVEKVNSDGSRVISFANGTRKDISADGQTIVVTFFNGDVKQIMPDQRVIYYYSEAQTTHTTYPDGMEVLQFPSKQIEKHYRDGTKEIIFPDQTIKYLYPNGAEECVFSDGTIQKVSVEGERTIEFPNGQRETHTKYYKKREYPDGTVKTVYPDGRTETRYATGRVRVKDRDGRVLVDSSSQMR